MATRLPSRLRAGAATAVLAAAALVTSGCSGAEPAASAGGTPVPTGSSSASAAATTEAGSDAAGGPADAAELYPAIQAAVQDAGTVSFSVGVSGQQDLGVITGQQDSSTTPPRARVSISTAQGDLELLFLADTIFLNGLTGPEMKPWVRIQRGATDPVSQSFAPLFEQLDASSDLTAQLELFSGAGSLEQVGPADVDGTPVTLWTGSIDVAAAAAATQGPQSQRQSYQALLDAGITEAPIELYVDDQQRPLRIVTSIGPATTTIDYTGYGEPVDVTPPAEDQIEPIESLGALEG